MSFPEVQVKIFDWNLFRVFRDQKDNIIQIVLEKDSVFREFAFESQAKWIDDSRVKLPSTTATIRETFKAERVK